MRTLMSRLLAVESSGQVCYVELSGDSDETKPTSGIADGSIFTESDTGDVYLFNEASGDWVKQFSLQT